MITSPLRDRVVCITGPTASGKTALALHLARTLDVDLISVDSSQVYCGMNVGSAKPTQDVLEEFPHALVNLRAIDEPYSAADFAQDARELVLHSFRAGRIPVLVGGTMFYLNALLEGLPELPPADPDLRGSLSDTVRVKGLSSLYTRLSQIDPMAAQRINANDAQRIMRAIEINMLTGKPVADQKTVNGLLADGISALKIAVNVPSRALLHRRIETRLTDMLNLGFVDEVRDLRIQYPDARESPAMRSVGYQQIWAYLENEVGFAQMREDVLTSTRRLAKRQLTWLRNERGVLWVDGTNPSTADHVLHYVTTWARANTRSYALA